MICLTEQFAELCAKDAGDDHPLTLDKLYALVDDALQRKEFDAVNELFAVKHVMSLDVSLGLLTITLGAVNRLPLRYGFFTTLRGRLTARADVDVLLSGLAGMERLSAKELVVAWCGPCRNWKGTPRANIRVVGYSCKGALMQLAGQCGSVMGSDGRAMSVNRYPEVWFWNFNTTESTRVLECRQTLAGTRKTKLLREYL